MADPTATGLAVCRREISGPLRAIGEAPWGFPASNLSPGLGYGLFFQRDSSFWDPVTCDRFSTLAEAWPTPWTNPMIYLL